MTVIGSASINIRASDKFFEKDIRKMVKGIKDVSIQVESDLNLTKVESKLQAFKKKISGQTVNFEVEMSSKLAHTQMEDFISDYDGHVVSLNLDVDTAKAFAKVATAVELIEQTTALIDVDANITKAEASLASIQKKRVVPIEIAAESEAEEIRKVVEEHLQDIPVDLHIDESSATRMKREMDKMAVTHLPKTLEWNADNDSIGDFSRILDHVIVSMRIAARTKVNNSFANLGTAMFVASKGATALFNTLDATSAGLKSLFDTIGRQGNMKDISQGFTSFGRIISGTLDFQKIRAGIIGILGNFESLTMVVSGGAAAFANLGSMALVAAGNVLAVGRDIGQAVGLLAAAPALIAGAAVGVSALTLAWKGFGDAFNEDPKKAAEALAKLPPEAQKAVKGIRGVGTEIRKATQTSYWKTMGTALQDTVNKIKGPLTTGMRGAGSAMAEQTVAVLGALKSFDGLPEVFSNINTGFKNAVGGTRDFTDAFLVLTQEGSKRLPMLGAWFSDLGKQFGDWIDMSAESGAILDWIDNAVVSVKELWSIGKDTIGILSGFTDIATAAGASGLDDFATAMGNIRATIDSPAFRTGMTTVFEAAYDAVDKLGDGLRPLAGTLGASADQFAIILGVAGDIGKITFENIDKIFNGTKFGTGIYEMFDGFRDAMAELEPSFAHLGDIIGDVGVIMGELLRNLAPGINQLTGTISGITDNLRDGIVNVMPSLNEFVQALLGLASGPIQGVAQIVGNLLTLFSKFPAGLQGAILTLALVARSGKPAMTFLSNFGTKLATTPGIANTAFGRTAMAAANMSARITKSLDWRRNFSQISKAWSGVATTFRGANVDVSAFQRIREGAGQTAKALGTTAAGGLRSAAGGIMSVLGGPWGVALAAAGIALTIWAQKNQEAKAKIDSLKSSINEQTGAFTGQTTKLVAEDLIDNKGFKEAAEAAGTSIAEIARKATSTKPELAEYASSWNHIAGQINQYQSATAGTDMAPTKSLKEFINVSDDMLGKLGLTRAEFEALSDVELENLASGIGSVYQSLGEARQQADLTRQSLEGMVETTLADNFGTMSDAMSSVDDKFSAFRSTLQLTGAETLSQQSAMRGYTETAKQTKDTIGQINDALSKVQAQKLYTIGEGFNLASENGRKLYDSVTQSAEGIQRVAVSAYDAALKNGASVEYAQKKALGAAAPMVASLRASLNELGFSKQQINDVIDAAGLLPKDIKMGITMNGAEEARAEAVRTQATVQAIANGDYKMVLSLIDDDARTKLQSTLKLGDNFSNKEYVAKVSLLAEKAGMDADALLAKLAIVDDPVKTLIELGLIDEATPKVNKAKENAKGGKGVIDVDAETSKATAKTDAAKKNANGTGKLDVDADTSKANAKTQAAKSQADRTTGSIKIDAKTDSISPAIQGVRSTISGTPAKVPVEIEKPKGGVMNGIFADYAIPSIKATITVNSDALNAAKSQISNLKPTPIKITVSSNVGSEAGKIRAALSSLKSATVRITASSNVAATANKARAALAGLKAPKAIVIRATNGVSAAANAARASLAGIKAPKAIVIRATNGVSAVAGAVKGALNGIKNKSVSIKANNGQALSSVSTVVSRMNAIKEKVAHVKGNNSDALSKISAVVSRLAGIRNKTFSITANNGQALSAIAAVNSRTVHDKSNTITTYTRTVAKNAAGGIYEGGYQTFASGGINAKALRAIQKSGGKDRNRVAQIAKASSNYRVWAEEETQGEAYIPFSKSKRPRSLQILSQVANKFGMGLFKSYADGGFSGATASSSPSTNRVTGSGNAADLTSIVLRALLKGRTALSVAGKQLVSGLSAGILANKGQAVEGIVEMSRAVSDAFQADNDIHSPSKKYRTFGTQLVKGLAIGVKSTRADAVKAIRDVSSSLYSEAVSISDKIKSLQKSSKNASKSAVAAAKDVNVAKKALRDAENKKGTSASTIRSKRRTVERAEARLQKATGGKSSAAREIAALKANYNAIAKVRKSLAVQDNTNAKLWAKRSYLATSKALANAMQARQRTRTKRDDIRGGTTLADYAKAIETLNKSLKSQSDKLNRMVDTRNSAMESVSSKLSGEFNLSSMVGDADSFGYRAPTTVQGIKAYAHQTAARIQAFGGKLNALRKKGYNSFLVNEVAGLGSEQGSIVADALLKGTGSAKTGDVAYLNRSYEHIFGTLKKGAEDVTGGLADTIGKQTADGMYLAGINIQKGLVKGLTDDVKALDRAADLLSKTLIAKFKKLMGIKSPSRVFMKLGNYIPRGLAIGIDDMKPVVAKSLDNLVPTKPFDVAVNGTSSSGASSFGGGTNGDGEKNAPQIVQHIHPTPGMSEEHIGQSAARELMFRYDYR